MQNMLTRMTCRHIYQTRIAHRESRILMLLKQILIQQSAFQVLQKLQDYGYVDINSRDYEEDHLISLELGGSPTDPKNLWPEPHPSTNEKDKVENYLHKQVCDGAITLAQAQNEITKNWYDVYQQIK